MKLGHHNHSIDHVRVTLLSINVHLVLEIQLNIVEKEFPFATCAKQNLIDFIPFHAVNVLRKLFLEQKLIISKISWQDKTGVVVPPSSNKLITCGSQQHFILTRNVNDVKHSYRRHKLQFFFSELSLCFSQRGYADNKLFRTDSDCFSPGLSIVWIHKLHHIGVFFNYC